MPSLSERLAWERNRKFVGREQEISIFQKALISSELPFNILHIFGPGGVGKTSLMLQLQGLCNQLKIPSLHIEARNLEPTPESVLSVLSSSMALLEGNSPLEKLAANEERQVIFIDTYENISSLDAWLQSEFLPNLSLETLVVLAGRNPLSATWLSDPGWQALIHALPLRNLSPEESLTYLQKKDIPANHHQGILNFTYGYPLALSLVADVLAQGQEISFQAETAPDIIKTLLERFIKEVPTPAHRMALQACAVVRLTTEALLTQILQLPDTHNLFEWLRGLSFIETGQLGLFPHDLAREVLIADLRWRNPDFYTQLHHQARSYYSKRLGQTQGVEKHRVLFDYIFLHRDNPAIRPRFTWGEQSGLLTDSLQESDHETILEIIGTNEGEESARIAAHWLQRQPQNVLIFRDSQPTPAGFAIMVALHEATSEDMNIDPGAIAAWQYLQNHAPLRPQEGATIFRFWMARDTYQSVSPIQSLIFVNFVQYFQKTPGLAFTFLPCAEPEAWAPMLTYFDLARSPAADFTIGGRNYGVYSHDWRVVSPIAWQELLAQREIAAAEVVAATTPPSRNLLVLSQSGFMEAVQDALRNFTRADTLHQNPLLRSRLVEEQVAESGNVPKRVAALQTLLKQAAESLQSSPRDEKLYRVIHRTYLQPAPTQETAAELLDLPFSTYRRHLKAGMTRIAEILWQREIS
ncbi:ATP-binding protein [Nostoc linckia FACHB-104]|nr:ATP-binding protein [Nostoc linckia FACHB-104]